MRVGGLLLSLVAMLALPLGATALQAGDAGIYIAVNEDGIPIRKVLRVTAQGDDWKFEDRQEDGSWVDVSCHGGCRHRAATPDDLTRFFGAAPPSNVQPDCVRNDEYAFCHLIGVGEGEAREGYALVLRIGAEWLPVTMVRLPGDEAPDSEDQEQVPLQSA